MSETAKERKSSGNPNAQVLVIYHAGCVDGAGAAYAAWLRYGDDRAEYLPAQYGEPAPSLERVKGRNVFVLDFSYDLETLERMATAAARVEIADHHKSAMETLAGLPPVSDLRHFLTAHFDMTRSGAALAWGHFHGVRSVPNILLHIEDRDLWKFKMEGTKEIHAALVTHGVLKDFRVIGTYDRRFLTDLKTEGALILKHADGIVETLVGNAREVTFAGHRVLCANAPIMQSEVAGKLAEGRPFGMAWFWNRDGKVVVSLRSSDGGMPVDGIAKTYGGGGHAKAAGFQWPRDNAPPSSHDDLHIPWLNV